MPKKPTYPVIIYPNIILEFCLNNPKVEEFKTATIAKQVLKQPTSQPKSNLQALSFIALSFSSMLIVLLIYYFGIQQGNWLVVGSLALVIIGVWAILGATTFTNPNKQEIKTHRAAKTVEIEKPPQEFIRQKKLAAALTGKILEPSSLSTAQQGVSEAQFFRELKRFFRNVEQGVTFKIPGFGHPYSADFILRHPTGVSIDIEIDEPYVGNTGKPHHAIDQGKDQIRNKFFVEHNWIVVRFSEEQVVRYPRSCCKVIATVLSEITGDKYVAKELENTPALPLQATWTIKEARNMAKHNYRSTYL